MPRRTDAAIVVLARNREAQKLQATVEEFEARFNSMYRYPYVFLNDERFDEAFIQAQRKIAPNSEMWFGQVRVQPGKCVSQGACFVHTCSVKCHDKANKLKRRPATTATSHVTVLVA